MPFTNVMITSEEDALTILRALYHYERNALTCSYDCTQRLRDSILTINPYLEAEI